MVSVAEAEQGNGCSSASCSALGGHAHKPERDVPLTLCGTASLMMCKRPAIGTSQETKCTWILFQVPCISTGGSKWKSNQIEHMQRPLKDLRGFRAHGGHVPGAPGKRKATGHIPFILAFPCLGSLCPHYTDLSQDRGHTVLFASLSLPQRAWQGAHERFGEGLKKTLHPGPGTW